MEKYYLGSIIYEEEVEDSRGNSKTKAIREKYLVLANDLGDAESKLKTKMNASLGSNTFEITQIREFSIIGIIE